MNVDDRTLAVALAVLVAASGVGLVAGGATHSSGPATPATTTTGAVDAAASAPSADPPAASAAEMVECTNGTSRAVIECGYNPGPTSVSIDDQDTTGRTVTVDGVELADGGFVAVHRLSFVDGAFTGSLLGVSGDLSAGLHRDVTVELDEPIDGDATLVAVVYRDTDGDGEFDFVSTDGAVDGPYTNTYSERAGNVTDEAGDVIGDTAAVTVDSVVAGYAGGDGVVGDAELRTAIGDWVAGDLTDADLQAVVRAWVAGGPTADRSLDRTTVVAGESVTATVTVEFDEPHERISIADGFEGPFSSTTIESVTVGDTAVEPRFAGRFDWGIQVVLDREVPAGTEVQVTYTVTAAADAAGERLQFTGARDRGDVRVDGATVEFGTATVAIVEE